MEINEQNLKELEALQDFLNYVNEQTQYSVGSPAWNQMVAYAAYEILGKEHKVLHRSYMVDLVHPHTTEFIDTVRVDAACNESEAIAIALEAFNQDNWNDEYGFEKVTSEMLAVHPI